MTAIQDAAALAPVTAAALEAAFEPLVEAHVPAVLAVEQRAHGHPWTHGNFVDALKAGYQAQLLKAGDTLIGYFVAMKGVDEVHLLNVVVAEASRSRGYGALLVGRVVAVAEEMGSEQVCLEVRVGNGSAIRLYERLGFRVMGRRPKYYADNGEDALLMGLVVTMP